VSERQRLAARLGHSEARAAHPDGAPVDWADWQARLAAIREASELCGRPLPAAVAADYAERVLPLWEAVHPGDPRPREAFAAAREWAECPCEGHRLAAAAAANAAPAGAADYAAYAAYAAAAATLRVAVAYASDAAAYAAAYAAYAAAGDTAADNAAATAAEGQWQQRRLAAYLMGEVAL
jgi:hypothetical protein